MSKAISGLLLIALGVPVSTSTIQTSENVAPSEVKSSSAVQYAITYDSIANPTYPGRYAEVTIPSADGLRSPGLLYVASGRGPHPTVLLLHGYPGGDDSRDLAQAMKRFGWNVLIFHYRGLWGSPGAFSFSHAIEDTDAALGFLRDNANAKKYRIDRQRLVLIGDSIQPSSFEENT